MKQEFAEQLAHLEEALELERSQAQENMNKLKEELQEKYESEISVLRSHHDEMAKEQARLEKALHEEKEKLKSLQDALENDESKNLQDSCNFYLYKNVGELHLLARSHVLETVYRIYLLVLHQFLMSAF